ncbi:hypothetical protein [Thalassoglobus polymorphus]|uniref:Uncharacterized protein n=1 Tax=Thalassoglobus polymorphus TaxID=2527994 RepID=A0A517QL84_9PLAN|nr:hypothetical protein [Thalassoglobus polymorphus]QDT32402.1 hypothetical protein Mal48_16480 [Thalassoglobus polymorphus]
MKPLNAPHKIDHDFRLYVPYPEGWKAHIKQGWEKQYCYAKNEGEDFFHLILNGEIFLVHGDEKYCLNCAMKQGILTSERLHWQNKRPDENRTKL